MTELQNEIYFIIKRNPEGIFTADIAKEVYSKVRKDLRPQNQNNSIICAIREINRKYPNTVKGYNRGSKGKLFYLKSYRVGVMFGKHMRKKRMTSPLC